MSALDALRDLIQEDVNNRGLRADSSRNLVNAYPGDFRAACQSLAQPERPYLAVVTGFFIPTATPPAGETDGPLGALFLARALLPLGCRVALVTDDFCARALHAGLAACALQKDVPVIVLPSPAEARQLTPTAYADRVLGQLGPVTHLLAIERVGPSHTLESLQRQQQAEGALGETMLDFLHDVPPEHQDRCHTMRGRDITDQMSPAHYLFEAARTAGLATIGIGDGGNEIGMGKIAWEVIRRNIPGGGLVACRVPTDHLIVCGISNWGAYALALGVARLRQQALDARLFDGAVEQKVLQTMVHHGPLVDGVRGRPAATVDGLDWQRYAAVLERLGLV
jgi:hypothetical protein